MEQKSQIAQGVHVSSWSYFHRREHLGLCLLSLSFVFCLCRVALSCFVLFCRIARHHKTNQDAFTLTLTLTLTLTPIPTSTLTPNLTLTLTCFGHKKRRSLRFAMIKLEPNEGRRMCGRVLSLLSCLVVCLVLSWSCLGFVLVLSWSCLDLVLVLSCLILSCLGLVLSCLVLSCLALSCLVESYLAFRGLVLILYREDKTRRIVTRRGSTCACIEDKLCVLCSTAR